MLLGYAKSCLSQCCVRQALGKRQLLHLRFKMSLPGGDVTHEVLATRLTPGGTWLGQTQTEQEAKRTKEQVNFLFI